MAIIYLFIFLITLLLLAPLLLGGTFVYLAKAGFDLLNFSSSASLLMIVVIIIGSFINIPLGGRRMVRVEETRFFGLVRRDVWRTQGLSLNVGGVIIPLLIVGYFLSYIPQEAVVVTTIVVSFFSFMGAKFVKERGILISMFLPVLFAVFFSLLLAPDHAPQVAFSSGVLGVLIGADLLRIPFILNRSGGVMCVGGGGIFDGIFLVGIISALVVSF
jgi:uncharacterized membrane protein